MTIYADEGRNIPKSRGKPVPLAKKESGMQKSRPVNERKTQNGYDTRTSHLVTQGSTILAHGRLAAEF